MKYLNSYTSPDGETHIEELDSTLAPADFIPGTPLIDLSAPHSATTVVFARLVAGWFGDYHPSPRRQFAITLTGEAEVLTSDGQKRVITPGTIWLIEDTHGKGHQTRVSEKGDWTIVLIGLQD
ncbi:MAG TPA: hypothetical protein VF786_07275 [Terriglobales bacterium]